MKVELIASTNDPEKVVAAAAKLCYSKKDAANLMENLTMESVEKFIEKLASMGHESPFEHVSFTFSISGVSRALLAQITRHRIASYSVRSQRYVNESEFEYITPTSIANNPVANMRYIETMNMIRDAYNDIAELLYNDFISAEEEKGSNSKTDWMKVAQEDARYVLPNAAETKMVITMNARSLFNFFELRCCNRAQKEIRDVAYEMLKICYNIAPNIFKYAGPSCYHGTCKEGGMSCGKAKQTKEKGNRIRGIGC